MHVLIVALIPLLPLAGFVITLLLGKRPAGTPARDGLAGRGDRLVGAQHDRRRARASAHHTMTIDFNLFTWISAGSFHVQWGYLVDSLTGHHADRGQHHRHAGALLLDRLHARRRGYYRFFAYLNLFMFAMFVLILANNYLLLFLGWEGVGLCSYLLISFWFRKKSASQAGKKAFLVNRVGDWGFTLGMFLMFATFGSLQFGKVFARVPCVSPRHRHLDLPAAVRRRGGQERPVPAARLAARRHGGPDPGQRPDPRRHHGQRRRLHGRAQLPARQPLAHGHAGGDDRRHLHGHLRGLHRAHPERHQEGDRLLHHLVAGLHVHGPRRRRLGGGHLLPVRPRLLQGPALPGLGLGDPLHVRRAGHAPAWAACARSCPSPSGRC